MESVSLCCARYGKPSDSSMVIPMDPHYAPVPEPVRSPMSARYGKLGLGKLSEDVLAPQRVQLYGGVHVQQVR